MERYDVKATEDEVTQLITQRRRDESVNTKSEKLKGSKIMLKS